MTGSDRVIRQAIAATWQDQQLDTAPDRRAQRTTDRWRQLRSLYLTLPAQAISPIERMVLAGTISG